jgi:hypothetical protein
LHARLMELLDIDGLGIKTVRPGAWSPFGPNSYDTAFFIHAGVNRTQSVVFSHDSGEIESAAYLWSNKKLKNAAFVTSKWLQTVVFAGTFPYYALNDSRRYMHVDASDIDEDFETPPTDVGDPSEIDILTYVMELRGLDALSAQKDVAITRAELAKDAVHARYRSDFGLGDFVTVIGGYNESSIMRVTEFVEIEDETGRRAYPTLSVI